MCADLKLDRAYRIVYLIISLPHPPHLISWLCGESRALEILVIRFRHSNSVQLRTHIHTYTHTQCEPVQTLLKQFFSLPNEGSSADDVLYFSLDFVNCQSLAVVTVTDTFLNSGTVCGTVDQATANHICSSQGYGTALDYGTALVKRWALIRNVKIITNQ